MDDSYARLWSEFSLLLYGLKDLNAHALESTGTRCEQAGAGVLSRLELMGPVRLTDLAASLGLDPSSVSRQVTSLERAGWLLREKDPSDQRAQRLKLTASGAAVVAVLRTARQQALARLTPEWSEQELDDLARCLARLNTDLESHRQLLGVRQETA